MFNILFTKRIIHDSTLKSLENVKIIVLFGAGYTYVVLSFFYSPRTLYMVFGLLGVLLFPLNSRKSI